jgi:tripartite-type tricarboxylate transporter receptor subunit TctC
MIHVPYRGAAPAMNDLIPGRVHLLFSGGATLDNARSGQVQVLGYTGAKRSAIASNVPTIAESGVPGFDVVSWYRALKALIDQPKLDAAKQVLDD